MRASENSSADSVAARVDHGDYDAQNHCGWISGWIRPCRRHDWGLANVANAVVVSLGGRDRRRAGSNWLGGQSLGAWRLGRTFVHVLPDFGHLQWW